jgi:nucleotide-binding universal stress UspA family protein
METILIATDFSAAARTATLYGFKLAKSIHAKVVLFTAYQAPAVYPDGSVFISPDDNERMYFKKLLEEAEALDPLRTVALETECYNGPITDSILGVAEERNAAYIIVGMKGSGREMRKFFGSTVTYLCKKSFIPVIVVPEEAAFSIPKTIALASDINEDSDIHILKPFKKLALNFNSRVFIVKVIKKSMDQAAERLVRPERLKDFLSFVNYTFEYLEGDNVAKAMNTFVKQHAVDMVAVIPHEHTLIERLFTRSVTKDLVFHSHVPLLIIPSIISESTNAENKLISTNAVYAV